jgi:adrenodoxin-NADP+ reductase
VIASTMHDAYSVADQLLADHYSSTASGGAGGPLPRQPESGLPEELEKGIREGKVVDLEKWGRIDTAERERGKTRGKEREKFRRVEDMLAVLS